MNPIAPVSMLPAGNGSGAALVVGAVLILALIYAKRQPAKAATQTALSPQYNSNEVHRFPPIYEKQQ